MTTDPERSAAEAAELALVRVVHHFGGKPGFVLLGGLVPQMLCANSPIRHAGTTDVDVQVDLELQQGTTNAARLEQALRDAEFTPDTERIWRWRTTALVTGAVAEVKFELLADLDDQPQGAIMRFDDCDALGATNLRGTGFASKDVSERAITATDGGVQRTAVIDVAGLGGFLMAKTAAAYGRHKSKDWYDIAYVLINNDANVAGEDAVTSAFGSVLPGSRSALTDLRANFEQPDHPGPVAYADQVLLDHPELDRHEVQADAVLSVIRFCGVLLNR